MGLFTDLIDHKVNQYKLEAQSLGLTFVSRASKPSHGIYLCSVCNEEFPYQISALRTLSIKGYKVNCPNCLKVELKSIQEELNISDLTSVGTGLYTFTLNACGHSKKQPLNQLRAKNIWSCVDCAKNEKIAVAATNGLTFKSPFSNGRDTYTIDSCGHTVNLSKTHVYNESYTCQECYQIKLKESAESLGLKYVGKSNKGAHYRACIVVECGHHKDVQVNDLFVTRRPLKCLVCTEIKHNDEALTTGLEFIGKSDCGNPNYRKYRTKCCGSTQDFEVTHIRRGHWNCHTCNYTYTKKPNNLYLLEMSKDNNSWLKLGYSKDVRHRINQYGLNPDIKVQVTKVIKFSTGKEVIKIEKYLHKRYKDSRLNPETMKPYFNGSGYTECYPYSLKETLMDELQKLEFT